MGYELIKTHKRGLDEILGGGLIRGHVIEVCGGVGGGKSLLTMMLCHKRNTVIIDLDNNFSYIENGNVQRMKNMSAINLYGMDIAEVYKAVNLIPPDVFTFVVVDSLGSFHVNEIKDLLPSLKLHASTTGNTVIVTNHMNTPYQSRCSWRFEQYASQRLEIQGLEPLESDSGNVVVPFSVKCIKSLLPHDKRTLTFYLSQGET